MRSFNVLFLLFCSLAAIAQPNVYSKAQIDNQRASLTATIATKAPSTSVVALATRVDGITTTITGLAPTSAVSNSIAAAITPVVAAQATINSALSASLVAVIAAQPSITAAIVSLGLVNTAQASTNTLVQTQIAAKVTYLSITQARALTLNATQTIGITDKNRAGNFVADLADTTTPDDGAVCLVTANGKRLKRVYDGPANILWWGAIGDASEASAPTNNTAIQAAINYVCAANAPLTEGLAPTNKGRPNSLYAPSGGYYVSVTQIIPGALRFVADGGLSFGGTYIKQITPGAHLFEIQGGNNGISAAVQIEDMRLSQYADSQQGAIIYAANAGSYNSLYLSRLWFQGWDRAAIKVLKTDDLQVKDCTFDGGEHQAFDLGDPSSLSGVVENAVFSGNTFYWMQGGLGYLRNVNGFLFTNNYCYNLAGSATRIPFGIDASNNSLRASRVQIIGNSFDQTNYVYKDRYGYALIAGNTITGANKPVIDLGGGGLSPITGNRIEGNLISGVWSGTVNVNGNSVPNSAVQVYNTPVTNSHFANTIIDSTNASASAYYILGSGTVGNTFSDKVKGFSLPYNITNSAGNNINGSWSFQPSRTSLSLSTTGWTTSDYNELAAVSLLDKGGAYVVSLKLEKAGTEVIYATYIVTIGETSSGNTQPGDLTPVSSANYGGGTDLYVKLRLKKGAVHGIEATISDSSLAGGTLTYTISKLL